MVSGETERLTTITMKCRVAISTIQLCTLYAGFRHALPHTNSSIFEVSRPPFSLSIPVTHLL